VAELTTAALLCITGGDEFPMNYWQTSENPFTETVWKIAVGTLDRICSMAQECEMGSFSTPLPTGEASNWELSRFSKPFIDEKYKFALSTIQVEDEKLAEADPSELEYEVGDERGATAS
jgi:hypothetical protein